MSFDLITDPYYTTLARNEADAVELPVGTQIEDRQGDTAIKREDGTWEVTGIGETVWPSFFAYPLVVLNPELNEERDEGVISNLSQLDALPDGTVIVGEDKLRTVRFKQTGSWIDPSKPVATTWNLNTYVHARRYGFRVAFRPQ